MRGRDLIKLTKTVTKAGEWKLVTGTSKMPPSAFQLSKRASYRLGRAWHWRTEDLEGGGYAFRLLVAFKPDVEEFMAWLAIPEEDALRVIARLENHGDHPGLHCHSTCEDHGTIPLSDQNPRCFKRAPGGFDRHRRQDSVRTKSDAMELAYAFYGVKPERNWTLSG